MTWLIVDNYINNYHFWDKCSRRQINDIFKLFPVEIICMECQNAFSAKNKKKNFSMSSAENFTQHTKCWRSTQTHHENTPIFIVYNFDSLKPNFYIVKLGFTGVYIIFLISAQNIDCGYSLELPLWGSSNEYLQSVFWAEIWKISEFFYLKIFIFWISAFS